LGSARQREGIGTGAAFFRARELGQAKVQNLGAPVASQKYIFGLEVAMDDPFVMGRR